MAERAKAGPGLRHWADRRLLDLGKTQTELAHALGFSSRSQVTHLLDGERGITIDDFLGMCIFFEVSMAEMLAVLGKKRPKRG